VGILNKLTNQELLIGIIKEEKYCPYPHLDSIVGDYSYNSTLKVSTREMCMVAFMPPPF
jgi:hypothetical protein